MNAKERATAQKTAQILRAARKQQGLNQEKVATHLGISQSTLSRLEEGLLIPSASQWFDFCEFVGISADSILSGRIERFVPAFVQEGVREAGFKIPKKYSLNRASKVRATLPFLHYFREAEGDEKLLKYLEAVKVDPDFLIDLDHQVSLEFSLDLSRQLISSGQLDQKRIPALAAFSKEPEAHGGLGKQYQPLFDQRQLFVQLIQNARFYECNFNYQLEDQSAASIELSIAPELHMKSIQYRNDPVLGDFLCRYKKHYFSNFLQFGQKTARAKPAVEELECHYHGASRCVYRIPLAS